MTTRWTQNPALRRAGRAGAIVATLLALFIGCGDSGSSGGSDDAGTAGTPEHRADPTEAPPEAAAVADAPVATIALQPGMWRAAATCPGGDIVFGLDIQIDTPGAFPRIFLANGVERVQVLEIHTEGTRWVLRLPVFNSTIDAHLSREGLRGTLTLVKRGGVEQTMPFFAQPGDDALAGEGPPPEISLTGRWRVHFTADDGSQTQAVGEFVQNGADLSGTFLTSTGDYRYLAGRAHGREFRISCFDGSHAYLFTGRVEKETIEGDFWSGTKWHERWTAQRDESASLPDPDTLTRLRDGHDRLAFAFPDPEGTVLSSDDPRFAGKVVLVAIQGSWCPNCNDEAAFTARLYDSHHAAGLEAVGLMYEHLRDFDRAAVQVRKFADKHHIGFPLLVAGYSDKTEASATLPDLDGIVAFPTLVVIDRRGAVRRIYTGFTGPGTGGHYESFTREFTGFIETLLDEQP